MPPVYVTSDLMQYSNCHAGWKSNIITIWTSRGLVSQIFCVRQRLPMYVERPFRSPECSARHYAPRASTSALRYLEVTARWYGTFVEKHNHPLQTYALPCAIECTGPFWDKSFEVVPRRNLTESGPRTEKHEFAMRSASWIEMGHGVSVM